MILSGQKGFTISGPKYHNHSSYVFFRCNPCAQTKLIFSILWNGFIDELVDPEWLIHAEDEPPNAQVLAESD